MISEQKIEEVKNRIVENFHPEKIILFGSYTKGIPNEDSDLDLLVVLKSDVPRKERRLPIYRLLHDFKFPIDLLVYTPEEIEYWKDTPMAFITQVYNEGRVIYG